MAGETSALEIDLGTGPSEGFAGLRRAIGALRDAGADFGPLSRLRPGEWEVLAPPCGTSGGGQPPGLLDETTIPASERRLHRESEHTFRVLSAAAVALCRGSQEVGRPVLLRGTGTTDLPTLRGLIRTAEYQRATGVGTLAIAPAENAGAGPADGGPLDFRAERARCLRLAGAAPLPPGSGPRAGGTPPAAAATAEGRLFHQALDTSADAVDRLRAAVQYLLLAFASANWEGAALVAAGCLPLTDALPPGATARLAGGLTAHGTQAFELEPEIFRHPADVRAFLLKALGIQATFRERHDDAVVWFRAMRATDGPLSPEALGQSHLLAALTLVKRRNALTEAVGEVEAGLAALPAAPGEPDSVRRERGWLHNLRGLTLTVQRDLVGALRHEQEAWASLQGLTDPSSVHLRVNLVSNISVLQEKAGKHAQALRTWQRFGGSGFTTDTKFVKHHAYRAGGLSLAVGDADGGTALLRQTLDRCRDMTDDFHVFEVSAELGALLLGRGDTTAAAGYFEEANSAATALGDPYRTALARTGRALAAGRPPAAALGELALRSSTNASRAEALAACVRAGSTDQARALLPAVRTKLNRPFDLVNF
ncbi:hypothetical protein [Streptomyces sp. NPDC021224]|uniref:hypothetical protein n=1 Tax=unclassified Streptomyces TaxID=2593676 RepID=UPI0037A5CD84